MGRKRRGRAFKPCAGGELERRALLASFSGQVAAISNIFGAGHDMAPDPGGGWGGVLPPVFAVPQGQGLVLTFDRVDGQVSPVGEGPSGFHGGDGGQEASGTTDITSYGGISGIVDPDRTMFLIGVFLTDAEPSDPAPERLTFRDDGDFSELSPAIAQTFFIGDGRTASGAIQTFRVPAGATRLFLGFADAVEFGNPTDPPGYYFDNYGALDVTLSIDRGPDLATGSLQLPAVAVIDEPFDVSWTVSIAGDRAAVGPWNDAIYLSADGTLDPTDLRLAVVPSPARIEVGGSYTLGARVSLPQQAANAFLILATDDGRLLAEPDESNNTAAQRVPALIARATGKTEPVALTSLKDIPGVKPGLQLVVLGNWSDDETASAPGSVQNLRTVLTELGAPASIEFSFATRFDKQIDFTPRKPGQTDRKFKAANKKYDEFVDRAYKNASILIEGLANAGKDITVTVYFGFHSSADASRDQGYAATLADQVAKFHSLFLERTVKINGGDVKIRSVPNLHIVLSPALEDEFKVSSKKPVKGQSSTPTFDESVLTIRKNLTRADRKLVSFRRSSTHLDALALTSDIPLEKGKIAVAREFHNPIRKGLTNQVYSNDGLFVYADEDLAGSSKIDENSSSGINVINGAFDSATVALEAFLSDLKDAIKDKAMTVNFWRPAYNLYPSVPGGAVDRKFDMDKNTNPLPGRRDRVGKNAAFGFQEQQVLRRVLGLPVLPKPTDA